MKADLTRVTFDPSKHYRSVLHQQGRVQLDADLNEAQSIQNDRSDESLTDVIGKAGVPRDRAGFEIKLAAGNKDLTIGAGRLYAGGIAIVSDGTATVAHQLQTFVDRSAGAQATGRQLVYVDAWERTISAIEDPLLREKALGGPDTAARTQVVWQVKLQPVANGATCSTLGNWQPADPTGKLEAIVAPPTEDDTLCSLPPLGGYTRTENQLYRIEVHASGTQTTAKFKWSRDNGAVAAAIVSPSSGTLVELDRLDPDTAFGFGDARYVEICDETTELDFNTKPILQASNPDVTTNTVTVSGAVSFDATKKPKLRRWDGTFTGSAATIPLEGGLSVKLSAGNYNAGDYWLVPARALLEGLPGTIEWTPGPQLPQGTKHHYAALALVDVVEPAGGKQFQLVSDCRDKFPALTDIWASDVSIVDNCSFGTAKTVQDAIDILCKREETCTISIAVGDDLQARFNEIPAGQSAQVCFPVGVWFLDKAVVVENKAFLKVSGAGNGTQILVRSAESAFTFRHCGGVTIRDMIVGAAQSGINPGNLGVVTFDNCAEVLAEALSLTLAHGISRASSGITTYQCDSVRIRDCDVITGNRTIGMLIVDAGEVWVNNCTVVTTTSTRPNYADRIKDLKYRAAVRSKLINSAMIVNTPDPKRGMVRNATVKVGAYTIMFSTPDTLKSGWQEKVDEAKPNRIESPQRAIEFLNRVVDGLITRADLATGWSPLNKWLKDIDAITRNVAAQGIVVAGKQAYDVRIEDNRLLNVQQGIHVGLSYQATSPLATRVQIRGNTVGVGLTSDSIGERHGIFVGNCESLVVENNRVSLTRYGNAEQETDGIRVYGYYGPFILVRANHLDGFNVGVHVRSWTNSPTQAVAAAAPAPGKKFKLWRVEENLLVGNGAVTILGAGVEAEKNYPM